MGWCRMLERRSFQIRIIGLDSWRSKPVIASCRSRRVCAACCSVGSGMPSDSFLFAGFLPVKDRGKRDRLAELSKIPATLFFFESPPPHRRIVRVAAEVLGRERRAVVCRELTKTFEEFRRGTLGELGGIL